MITKAVTLTKEGVYDYQGRKHFKPYEELAKGAATCPSTIPIVFEHPNLVRTDEGQVFQGTSKYGIVRNIRANPTDGTIVGVAEIDDAALIRDGFIQEARAIRSNTFKGVSLGFKYQECPESGEYMGKSYDVIQRGHEFEHVALTASPRVGCATLHAFGADSETGKQVYYTVDSVTSFGEDSVHLVVTRDESGTQKLRAVEDEKSFKRRCAENLLARTSVYKNLEVNRMREHDHGLTISGRIMEPDRFGNPRNRSFSTTFGLWEWEQAQKQLRAAEGMTPGLIFGAKKQ